MSLKGFGRLRRLCRWFRLGLWFGNPTPRPRNYYFIIFKLWLYNYCNILIYRWVSCLPSTPTSNLNELSKCTNPSTSLFLTQFPFLSLTTPNQSTDTLTLMLRCLLQSMFPPQSSLLLWLTDTTVFPPLSTKSPAHDVSRLLPLPKTYQHFLSESKNKKWLTVSTFPN